MNCVQIAESKVFSGNLAGNNGVSEMEKILPNELNDLFWPKDDRIILRQVITNRVDIFPEETQSPLYRYYTDYPLYAPPSNVMEYIDQNGCMDPEQAIQPQDFTNLLNADCYDEREIGYCLFPDGSGYVAAYGIRPSYITDEMEDWYRKWCKEQSCVAVYGHGNLRYKIANPADHFDCHYVNHEDGRLGTYYRRSIDLGSGGRQRQIIRHSFDLKDFGVDAEWLAELEKQGCRCGGRGYFETFDVPGTTLCLSVTRPCPLGGTEIRSRKWVGWRPVNGMLVRDPYTKCTEEYLKKLLIHTLVGRMHLYSFLHELYEEYHDLPTNAD